MYLNIAGVVLSYITTLFILPMILNMLVKAEFVRPNFRKENIPLGVGLVFILSSIITVLILSFVLICLTYFKVISIDDFKLFNNEVIYLYLFAAGIMTLLGLLDDVFGSREASGLKGHFKKLLFERELTTGGLKALIGGFIGLIISLSILQIKGNGFNYLFLIDALIIALSTNAINLLDLRPGRAGKGFLFFIFIILISSLYFYTPKSNFFTQNNNIHNFITFPLILSGCLLAYLPIDLKAKGMMGDTGSNVLGVTLGISSVLILPQIGQIIYLLFLIAFHLFTEKYSLTKVIDNNKVLKYLDQLGRG